MHPDERLALLSTLDNYDRQLIRMALKAYRYQLGDTITKIMQDYDTFEVHIESVRARLQEIDRMREMLEALGD